MTCSTCLHYHTPHADYPQGGVCRRHSPEFAGWPFVSATDICGDYESRDDVQPDADLIDGWTNRYSDGRCGGIYDTCAEAIAARTPMENVTTHHVREVPR